eukprot:scaffold86308_cov69-Phaeocystis_antarctica.AAC.2
MGSDGGAVAGSGTTRYWAAKATRESAKSVRRAPRYPLYDMTEAATAAGHKSAMACMREKAMSKRASRRTTLAMRSSCRGPWNCSRMAGLITGGDSVPES